MRAALVVDLGSAGLGAMAVDYHGREHSETFTGGAEIWPDVAAWLAARGVTEVAVRGPVGTDPAPWLTGQHFHATDEGIIGNSATIVTWRDTVSARAAATWFYDYDKLTAGLNSAGYAQVEDFLRRLPVGAKVTLIDAYDTSGPLVRHLALAGWSLPVEHVRSPWRVSVECYPDRHHVFASADGAHQVIETRNDAGGSAEVLAWIQALGPVDGVAIRDAANDSAALVGLVRAARFRYRVERATRGDLWGEPGDEYGGVKFRLGLRGLGWLVIDLQVGADKLEVVAGYMTSAWHDTVRGLHAALDAAEPTVIVWSEEPGAYHVVLGPLPGGVFDMEIRFLPDDLFGKPHDPDAGDSVARWTVGARDVARAFLSASHRLLQSVAEIDLNTRWNYGAPADELHRLAERLET